MPVLPRHHLVDLDPTAWEDLTASCDAALRDGPLRAWADQGWPLVVRRATHDLAPDVVPLGIPLPPSQGKLRVMLEAPVSAVIAVREPPALRDCMAVAPVAWQPTIAAIVDATPDARCYGSLAWQFLTGMPYLTERSDLDGLWSIVDAAEADRVASTIATIQAGSALRIDGELVSPAHRAVQWREWLSGADELLVKASDRTALVPRDRWFGS